MTDSLRIALPAAVFAITTYFVRKFSSPYKFKVEDEVFYPGNTLFVFDIHGVIFKISFFKMLSKIYKIPKKHRLLFLAIRPDFWYHAIKIYRKKRASEESLVKLSKKFPVLKQYKKEAIEIFNSQKLVPSTLRLIQDLRKHGYPLHILSNIGEETFAALKEKYPHVFKHFSQKHITKASNGYISKPEKKSFANHINTKYKHVVFIDDSKRNIKAANNLGLKAIRYKGKRSLAKVIKFLKIS